MTARKHSALSSEGAWYEPQSLACFLYLRMIR